ncbi:hypothetical protein [Rossellomorea marisflavi]|uniref:hypothetical protein n=1 Tax=Rossellomorea marisflavi TaxID=189381 RepID=UPI003457BC05
MNDYHFTVQPGEPLNRWVHTDLTIAPYRSEKAVFDHPVNITEEYVQIVYPGRQQFLDQRLKEEVLLPETDFHHIYFPFENPRLEFSAFIPTPHLLSVYGRTFIKPDEGGTFPFTVSTCGSVEIWVNGSKQLSWTPYTRNLASHKDITLTLEEGFNEIILYMDDLAERDVNYFTELRYTGQTALEGYIQVPAKAEQIEQAERLLTSLYFSKDIYRSGRLEVYMNREEASGIEELFVNVNRNHLLNPVFDSKADDELDAFDFSFKMSLDENGFQKLMSVEELSSNGLLQFDIGVVLPGGVQVARRMVASILTNDDQGQSFSDSLPERKQEILEFFSQSEKLDLNAGFSLIHLNGKVDEQAKRHIRSCFDEIQKKGDCADFRLAPLLGFTIKYQDTIPADFHEELKELAVNFRYWIDEPGNDVMWYFSENHALLFHVSQYFAGHLYPDATFSVSGRTGRDQYEKGKERLEEWFEVFLKYGYSEWNSTTYLPIDLIGFFSLYESAPDEHIRKLAKEALDFTFKIIAVNLHGKTMSTTYGRVYEHDLKAMEMGETANLAFITWKKGKLNTAMRCTTLFCLSTYEPPTLEDYFIEDASKVLVTQYKQGIKEVYTYNYKTSSYCMSAAIRFNSYKKGHQQHAMNIALDQDNTQIWINHPGEAVYSGENRPSFWAGNGISPNITQYKQYMFLEYRLKEPFLPYIHAYLPFWKLDEVREEGNWLFAKKDDAYIGLYFSNGYELQEKGAIAHREARSYGAHHRVIATCASEAEVGSFEAFVEEQVNAAISIESHRWSYATERAGTLSVSDDQLYANGKQVEYDAGYEVAEEHISIPQFQQ